jgi:20S proteasome subunit beta 1
VAAVTPPPTAAAPPARNFVRLAIAHAMARDGSSGGVIRMVTIDKGGVEREYIPGDQLPYGP